METTTHETSVPESLLASCEGFGVYGPSARIGVVERVRRKRDGRPYLLSVRAGLLGNWLVLVPVAQVEAVSADERRIVLRSGGLLAGPSPTRADAGTRGG
jgi:hypothetical protein